ncbi:unnamed protein product, partial [Natator depressus]
MTNPLRAGEPPAARGASEPPLGWGCGGERARAAPRRAGSGSRWGASGPAAPMVKRGRAARRDAGAGSPETMFESSRRMRSLWDGVRLEVAGESGGRPVVLHSFTQLDPDLPPLEKLSPGMAREAGAYGAGCLGRRGAQLK